MAYSRLFGPRALALFSFTSLGGTYLLMRSRRLAAKKQRRAAGDYSVPVDRSGGGI